MTLTGVRSRKRQKASTGSVGAYCRVITCCDELRYAVNDSNPTPVACMRWTAPAGAVAEDWRIASDLNCTLVFLLSLDMTQDVMALLL